MSAPRSGSRPSRRAGLADRLGRPPRGILLLGLAGTVLMFIGAPGGGGIPVRDPILGNSALSFWRYGHGQILASLVVYTGLALMVWAWVRLGREVLARRAGGRAVLTVSGIWALPMLITPPLFTRDPYSYLAQGALPLAGFDPYLFGPDAMGGIFTDNVHFFWQDTPAPYGPLFILLAQGIVLLVGQNVLVGVIAMRLALLTGVALLIAVLPALTRRLGGRPAVALWIAVANPVMIVHMVGGVHNDLLVVGLIPLAALLALQDRPGWAVAVGSLAMAVKASAGLILPFLVLIWAARLTGGFFSRLVRAGVPSVAMFLVVFGGCTWVSGFGLGWLPALSAPSMIVNWLSWSTGAGQAAAGLVGIVVDEVNEQAFVDTFRAIGGGVLAVLIAALWWKAREGGTVAIRNAAIAMALAAVLAPTTLPWYLSWGFCLLAMTAWSARGMQWVVFGSVWLMIVYFPNGETALYVWPFLLLCAVAGVLAAVSLLRPDPLGLRRGRPPGAPDDRVAGSGDRSGVRGTTAVIDGVRDRG
ncbi:polyprenol phosphomannose-dependent alpha 1,6 mannosyltransferase MptB [Pseudonocardia parietis]|uniref:Alpha-1,6-mannosyltransferase n=1 Tax=Pseudonocardia parietis TaxID=570936 RepID=A0ABS4VZI1_9PSEU|nr:polyprenol phosphomannose-dependent alpha 1,6 mannosyltransferase MptB [Pseudonocardia parietis]MBP2369332.1 alpha-1,6-mannosyltransferase [Pseudonocardia parietis]